MYGGHITDDWDRRLCRTYLAEYIRAEMLEGEILLAPGFQIPPNLDYKVRSAPSRDREHVRHGRPPGGRATEHGWPTGSLERASLWTNRPSRRQPAGRQPRKQVGEAASTEWEGNHLLCGGGWPQQGLTETGGRPRGQGVGGSFWEEASYEEDAGSSSPSPSLQGYHEYIDENLPPESPYLYGLHPNAEIGFLTVTSEKLFRTVLEMQPKETDSGAGTGVSREEKVGV